MKAEEYEPMMARVKDLLENDLVYREGCPPGMNGGEFMNRVYETALRSIRAEPKG